MNQNNDNNLLDDISSELINNHCNNDHIANLLQTISSELPEDVQFAQNKWAIKPWDRRGRNITLNFSRFKNQELRSALKLCICHKRLTKKIGALAAKSLFQEVLVLDRAIGCKSINNITVTDFTIYERIRLEKIGRNSAVRAFTYIEHFNNWLLKTFNFSASYKSTIVSNYLHGRLASDELRARKLLPTECIENIMRFANDKTLNLKDQFNFNALIPCIAGGFRIGELATLPLDCLVEISPGNLGLRYFPEKNYDAPIKPIPPPLNEAVSEAIAKLTHWTKDGRDIARKHSKNETLDWIKICRDPIVLKYHFEIWCHNWTSNPDHSQRKLSMAIFIQDINKGLGTSHREVLKPILLVAQHAHQTGKTYPKPIQIKRYEKGYFKEDTPIVVDSRINNGDVLLRASESLLVLPVYGLSEKYETSLTEFRPFSDRSFGEWLVGRKREGKKSKYKKDHSVFERHGIIDPRTKKPLVLNVHDIRHWLSTTMEEGGASQETIRLLFARNSAKSNEVYDQTSSLTRVNRIKQDIRSNLTTGLIQINYNKLLKTRGADTAEAYLEIKSGSMTNMTHGACVQNSHTSTCKHNLGCLSQPTGPCTSLFVDPHDKETKAELERIRSESIVLITTLHKDSPQMAHATNVVNNTNQILKDKEV